MPPHFAQRDRQIPNNTVLLCNPIEIQGHEDHEAGLDRMENPFFRAEHMPRQTGDSFECWQDKIDAWECGWQAAERISKHTPCRSARKP